MAQLGKIFYTGQFRHGLDDKNRLTIPSAWRYAHEESDTFLATPHPDGYIAVLPPAEVEKLQAKVAEKALTDATTKQKEAADKLSKANKTFVDADIELERRLGVTISTIFEIEGEEKPALIAEWIALVYV